MLPAPVKLLSEVDRTFVAPKFFDLSLLVGDEEVVAGIIEDSLQISVFAAD